MYVLGQVLGQDDLPGFTFHNSTDLLNVGRLNSSSGFRRFIHGWIDELRLTKGVVAAEPVLPVPDAGCGPPGAAGRDRHGA